jgi:hypothetical protein
MMYIEFYLPVTYSLMGEVHIDRCGIDRLDLRAFGHGRLNEETTSNIDA